MRIDQRSPDQLRELTIIPHYIKHAEGSVLISIGDTRVICTASVQEKVPPFMRGQGKGWVTAEYAMLPRATEERTIRESAKGKIGGRTMEIQRLIGRAMRSVVDLKLLGERTLWLDCDVIQADGGTRTISITGAYMAMMFALEGCLQRKQIPRLPVTDFLAAVSVGMSQEDEVLLDLCYAEDSKAKVDMNIVMTGQGDFVEVQGTGEEYSFSRQQMNRMFDLAEQGVGQLVEQQKEVLGDISSRIVQKEEKPQS